MEKMITLAVRQLYAGLVCITLAGEEITVLQDPVKDEVTWKDAPLVFWRCLIQPTDPMMGTTVEVCQWEHQEVPLFAVKESDYNPPRKLQYARVVARH